MKPLNLPEFAAQLRLTGNDREIDFADEILANYDFVENANFDELIGALDDYAKEWIGKPDKQVEWLGDRSNLLGELVDLLAEHGRKRDVDDELRELVETMSAAEEMLQDRGFMTDGDFLESLQKLCDKVDYDL